MTQTQSTTRTPYESPALEEFRSGSARRAARMYVERLAFTQRGRFAFLAALLLSINSTVQGMWTEGVRPNLSTGVPDPTLVGALYDALGMTLNFTVPVLGGVALLLLLDVYEEEIGVICDGE